ncbi:2-iminobutanoate/2-iminopropanoate deaminase-like [Halichondria panicea]|uniref:2-iminobutanoate/2-iminopropanoate deaminase-like n=1 Tax=Halichondria panicea TaxID=6063 RepID=UPI00312BBBFE
MANKIFRKIISTPNAPAAIGPYSQAVLVNTTLYLSGQIGLDPKTGVFVSDNVDDQARQSLINLGAVLEAAGTSFDKVVKTTVLFADLNDFESVNAIYATYFKDKQPARAAFQATKLPKGAKVEIEAVAVVGEIIDESKERLMINSCL